MLGVGQRLNRVLAKLSKVINHKTVTVSRCIVYTVGAKVFAMTIDD